MAHKTKLVVLAVGALAFVAGAVGSAEAQLSKCAAKKAMVECKKVQS
jgi:hypothetical protein